LCPCDNMSIFRLSHVGCSTPLDVVRGDGGAACNPVAPLFYPASPCRAIGVFTRRPSLSLTHPSSSNAILTQWSPLQRLTMVHLPYGHFIMH
jgi:hypothetical protein